MDEKTIYLREEKDNGAIIDIGGEVKRVEINGGIDMEVIIDKMYGPLIAVDLKVTMDYDASEWVISRHDAFTTWREVARIPMQLTTDFDCQRCHERNAVEGFEANGGDYCSKACRDNLTNN